MPLKIKQLEHVKTEKSAPVFSEHAQPSTNRKRRLRSTPLKAQCVFFRCTLVPLMTAVPLPFSPVAEPPSATSVDV